ncbi:UbiD family decarboxylase [Pigmentiphaga litoralis]|uniref:UbiD family decarboxylase n=1 Tax=Pigmentiphaga litoralis TaxID=516702 RepID=A0A7Y9LNU1_9BURK|nr:UbiD family decarboxylase [Pigmentiphaga litoralis]NYE22807.1 UbiD family decarboxylase [Pigmentiphaga litoralis]NYE83578.1 UbiD family decarboxylase [Pigmentiphaga litoralis]
MTDAHHPAAPAAASALDMERFRLKNFLESLGDDELDRRTGATPLTEIAAILEGNPRAVWFDAPGGESTSLCGSVVAGRNRIAQAFGTTPDGLLPEIMARLRRKGEVVDVPRDAAPVQQVVLTGDDCDLTALPVHLQHGMDGAPYISASIDFVRDPETGWTNVGIRRLMLRGRRVAGVDVVAPSDLRAIYLAHAGRGERLPIAFAVGSHPIDHVAATMRIPTDELALIASLRDAPLPVVKCVTNDLRVPADAEFIIEGYLHEHGHSEPEGPYGEFLGYYGGVKRNPLFHVTAITHRRDAVFQTATISGPSMATTDTAQLSALRTEVMVWRALETAVRQVDSVYANPATGGMFNVRVAMRQRVPGEARNAITAVFSSLANVKHVFVVDPDIDIFSDAQMDWALATRFQADRDLVVVTGLRAMPLDPSLAGSHQGAKAGFDLTLPILKPGAKRSMEHRVPAPPVFDGARFDSWLAALEDGPKSFGELMSATGTKDGREVVRWLEDIAATRSITRDDEGRYQFEQ